MNGANRLFSARLATFAAAPVLALLAGLGNIFSVSLAFGVDLIFGPIFVFIAVAFLSLPAALAVAGACGAVTWFMWGHPYAGLVFALEAAIVFGLSRRRGKSLLSADILFWVVAGMPITLLYLTQIIALPFESSWLITLKQFINAVFNVLVASLAVLLINIGLGRFSRFYLGRQQIKNILFHSLVALILGAGTLPIIQSSKHDERNTENLLVARLSGLLNHLATDVELSERPADEVLADFVARPRIDSSLAFAILDPFGTVVASNGGPWTDQLRPTSAPMTDGELRFLEPPGNLSFVQALRQGRYQMVQSVNNGEPLTVVVQAPSGPVAAQLAGAAFKLVVLLGVLLLLGILASQILSRVLTAPIWRLSTALNSSTNGIVITDLEGRVEWLNEGFTRISGYGIEDMKGRKLAPVLANAGADEEAVTRIRRALADRRSFEEEVTNRGKDGLPYWVRINCEPLRAENGGITGFIAVETEVTEQRRMSELELFGREALEKLARRGALEEVYRTVLANLESMIRVRCVIELGGPDCEANTYFPPASYLLVGKGSIAALASRPWQVVPVRDSQGLLLGSLRILRLVGGPQTPWEVDVINRACQVISIATERFWSDRKLQETASVFRHVDEGIFLTDPDFVIVVVNAAFSQITGCPIDEAAGCKVESLFPDQGTAFLSQAVLVALDQFGQWQGETALTNKRGDAVELVLKISAIRGERGAVRRYIFLISDITELKTYQRQLESMARYDALTGLPNRVLLGDRLDQAMRQAERNRKRLAVLFLDLDGFKQVNDTLGHESGDQLLRIITHRISEELRDSDTFSRFGGDEFVIVLPELEKQETADDVVRRILAAVARHVLLSGRQVDITASIGLTFYPQKDDLDADQLLRQADQAMYAAKQQGRNGYQYFDTENDKAVREFHESVGQVSAALQNGEFVLFYQPKVNMRTGAVIGLEALIRWQHPARGLVAPGEFLPLIEHHALSVRVGEWVLEAALRQMAEWRDQGFEVPVSVNINSFHLRQKPFACRLKDILERYPSVPAGELELEIVETSALEDLETVSELIHECRSLGVVFSLDDFGTGYSSLSYLRRLPVEKLKIDMSFVRDMLRDPNDFAIVQGILGLADSFGLDVIAEGVETPDHSARLMEIGCLYGQGYGIAKPMPGDQVQQWAGQWRENFPDGLQQADSVPAIVGTNAPK